MLPLARANGRQVRRGGSRALFEQLYRREHSHVRRYLLNSVRGDVERADDLTGDVFREVWRTYALPLALMGDADAQRLLTTAAKHRLIDLWYMDSKLVFVAGNDDTHLPLDTGSDTAAFDRVLDAGLVA
jgi:DNA-directed RNA polymerase specialized sigma24 family protein